MFFDDACWSLFFFFCCALDVVFFSVPRSTASTVHLGDVWQTGSTLVCIWGRASRCRAPRPGDVLLEGLRPLDPGTAPPASVLCLICVCRGTTRAHIRTIVRQLLRELMRSRASNRRKRVEIKEGREKEGWLFSALSHGTMSVEWVGLCNQTPPPRLFFSVICLLTRRPVVDERVDMCRHGTPHQASGSHPSCGVPPARGIPPGAVRHDAILRCDAMRPRLFVWSFGRVFVLCLFASCGVAWCCVVLCCCCYMYIFFGAHWVIHTVMVVASAAAAAVLRRGEPASSFCFAVCFCSSIDFRSVDHRLVRR